MVTFSTDYWAPAMEVNVRRRTEKSLFNDASPSSQGLPPLNHEIPWNALRHEPTIDSSTSSSSSGSGSESQSSRKAPMTVPSKKQTLIHKIFHHGNNNDQAKTNGSSPPASPDHYGHLTSLDEDPFVLANASPLEKKNIFNFTNVIGRGSFSGDPGLAAGAQGGTGGATGTGDNNCTLLKKYGLCDKGNIGQGATAVVRLAHKLEEESEKLFAVKEFRKRRKNESEKEYIKKLMSEFCISSSLHHENVVETVDLVQDEQHHWCEVMEYCCGGDLYNAIKQGHMGRIEINCCFKQLINGVAYLHSMGVAHRDIKPENLLLDGNGRLKITDFGVSDVFRMGWEKSPHLSRGLCGSEPYIAPEEFKTKEYDARRVDIWACGIVYYCMVYQGIPFRAATAQDPNFQHFVEMRAVNNYAPFEKLAVGCRQLMKRILDPNPETRITILEILEDEWFKSIETCGHGQNQNPHRHCEPDPNAK